MLVYLRQLFTINSQPGSQPEPALWRGEGSLTGLIGNDKRVIAAQAGKTLTRGTHRGCIMDPVAWWQVQVDRRRQCQIIALHNCLDYARQWPGNWINGGVESCEALKVTREAPAVLLAILASWLSRFLGGSQAFHTAYAQCQQKHINNELNTCQFGSRLINCQFKL